MFLCAANLFISFHFFALCVCSVCVCDLTSAWVIILFSLLLFLSPLAENTPFKKEKDAILNAPEPPLPSRSLPASTAVSRAPSPLQDLVVFREITATRGVGGVLSEKEKARKWDALLKKSDQAGGTLHLSLGNSSGQLDSDQLSILLD